MRREVGETVRCENCASSLLVELVDADGRRAARVEVEVGSFQVREMESVERERRMRRSREADRSDVPVTRDWSCRYSGLSSHDVILVSSRPRWVGQKEGKGRLDAEEKQNKKKAASEIARDLKLRDEGPSTRTLSFVLPPSHPDLPR